MPITIRWTRRRLLRMREPVRFEGAVALPEGWTLSHFFLQVNERDPEILRLWLVRRFKPALMRWLTFWQFFTVDLTFGGTLQSMGYLDDLKKEVERWLLNYVRDSAQAKGLLEAKDLLLAELERDVQEMAVRQQELNGQKHEAIQLLIYAQRLVEDMSEWNKELSELGKLLAERERAIKDVRRLVSLVLNISGLESEEGAALQEKEAEPETAA